MTILGLCMRDEMSLSRGNITIISRENLTTDHSEMLDSVGEIAVLTFNMCYYFNIQDHVNISQKRLQRHILEEWNPQIRLSLMYEKGIE